MALSPRIPPSIDDVVDAGLRLLTYRPRSEEEIRRRLSRRFPPPLVEEAIVVLTKRELLDDAGFARFWRQTRERNRPKGASALRWELRRLGVSREVVEDALQGLDEEENAYRAAIRVARRLGQDGHGVFRKKLAAYLRRRGFVGEVVTRTVQRLWWELTDPNYSYIEGSGQQHEPHNTV